ncbi:MAG: rsmG [Devosia sp.]|nr:rsmG [Devosia sp.]
MTIASELAERYVRQGSADAIAADLQAFWSLLTKWNVTQNLVSRETIDQFWQRHVADSLQLLPLIAETDRTILDFGSGGGFPALPLAIALKTTAIKFDLYEPVQKKAAFLRMVARELSLPVKVHNTRLELRDSRETPPDLLTARAVAPLTELNRLIHPYFGATTHALFPKGREHGQEIVQSELQWQHDIIAHQSDTDAASAILEIRNLRSISKT